MDSGKIGAVTWSVVKLAGMKGMMEIEFLRPIDPAIDAEAIARRVAAGVTMLGAGQRTYCEKTVLLKRKVRVQGWREEVEKIAKRFAKT